MSARWMFLFVAACAGCGGAETPELRQAPRRREVTMDAAVRAPSEVVRRACTEDADCNTDETCTPSAGCDAPRFCIARATCSSDHAAFCDCDGATFYASSNCPDRPFFSAGACEGGASGFEPFTPLESDATCASSDACSRGRICTGLPGCGNFWVCERVRGCRRDRVPFCGCDGSTFLASSNCPGQPFLHRGPCGTEGTAIAEGPEDAGAPAAPIAAVPATPAVAIATAPPAVRIASPSPPAPAPHRENAVQVQTRASGLRCLENRDCAPNEFCRGTSGCAESQCAPRPPQGCNPDTQYFCDCSGETFRASMNCPGRPFAHRGSCLPGE